MKRWIGAALAAGLLLAGCGGTTEAITTSSSAASSSAPRSDVLSDPQVQACARVANDFDAWRVEWLVPLGMKLQGGASAVAKEDRRKVRNSLVPVWQSLDTTIPAMGSDPAGSAWAGVVTNMRTYIRAYDDGAEAEQYQALTAVANGGESATSECSAMLDRKGG